MRIPFFLPAKRKYARDFVLAIALLVSSTSQAMSALTPFKVSYDVDYSIARGVMTLALEQAGDDKYTIDTVTKAEGAARLIIGQPVSEHASFEVIDGAVRATSYLFDAGNKNSNKNMRIDYNWASSQATLESEKGTETRHLASGSMDQLVMQAAAILEVKAGKKHFSFTQLKPGRKPTSYIYQYVGEETLKTDLGELKTVKYSRAKEGDKKHTLFWFALEHDYTPVQLEGIKKDKTVFKATLHSME